MTRPMAFARWLLAGGGDGSQNQGGTEEVEPPPPFTHHLARSLRMQNCASLKNLAIPYLVSVTFWKALGRNTPSSQS